MRFLLLSTILLAALRGVRAGQHQNTICKFYNKESMADCQEPWRNNVERRCPSYRSQDVDDSVMAHAGLKAVKFFNGMSMTDWIWRQHNEWEWDWDASHVLNSLAQLWWPVMWAVILVLLIILTVTFIPIWLFCCCCRKAKMVEARSKVAGIVTFSILMTLALVCTIGAQISAFRAVQGVEDLQCEGMAQPYDFLYDPTPVRQDDGYHGGPWFDGLLSFLTFGDLMSERTRNHEDLVRASNGRLGRLLVPMVRGLYAPLLWTNWYLTEHEYHGWGSVDGSDPKFTLGLRLRHAEEFDRLVQNSTEPIESREMSHSALQQLLLEDTKMLFDYPRTLDATGKVIEGLEEATETLNRQVVRISNGMQKIQDLSDDMGPNQIFEQSPWQYHWFPIVTYLFLALGCFFFLRYLRRKDDADRPTRGLRLFIYCGFIGSCIWMAWAVCMLSLSSVSADMCSFAHRELLQYGRYPDYFDLDVQGRTTNLIESCLVDTGNGDLLSALEIDLDDLNTISSDDLIPLKGLLWEYSSLSTRLLSDFVKSNLPELDLVESLKYPSPEGHDALSREALQEITEELNSVLGAATYVCTLSQRSICSPGVGQSVYILTMDNTFYHGDSSSSASFFKQNPPSSVLIALESLSTEARREWFDRATDLIIRSRLYKGEGFRRGLPPVPTTDIEWTNLVYDVCQIGEDCSPFHVASRFNFHLNSIRVSPLASWRFRMKQDMTALVQISLKDTLVHSLISPFQYLNPLRLIQDSASTVRTRWNCKRAFDVLDNLFRVTCAKTAGNVAVNGWLSLLMSVVMLVGFSILMHHWTNRRRSYLAAKKKTARKGSVEVGRDLEATAAEEGEEEGFLETGAVNLEPQILTQEYMASVINQQFAPNDHQQADVQVEPQHLGGDITEGVRTEAEAEEGVSVRAESFSAHENEPNANESVRADEMEMDQDFDQKVVDDSN